MVFTRFVERGRVVLINQGPEAGKLGVIVNVIDQARALVDCSVTGVRRAPLSFKHMSLTDFKIDIPLFAKRNAVAKAFVDADIQNKWDQTAWAKKRAQRVKRANLTDFERFIVAQTRASRSLVVRQQVNAAKKQRKAAAKQ
eukprot:m.11870 g.11870  ORF g.11870 m.11870 type:complete len:141 (+) comp6680_c1_seq1:105-527(+)